VDYCRDYNFAKDLELDADYRWISAKGCVLRFNDATYLNENIYRALETYCGTKYEKYGGLDKDLNFDHNGYLDCLDEYGSKPTTFPNAETLYLKNKCEVQTRTYLEPGVEHHKRERGCFDEQVAAGFEVYPMVQQKFCRNEFTVGSRDMAKI